MAALYGLLRSGREYRPSRTQITGKSLSSKWDRSKFETRNQYKPIDKSTKQNFEWAELVAKMFVNQRKFFYNLYLFRRTILQYNFENKLT